MAWQNFDTLGWLVDCTTQPSLIFSVLLFCIFVKREMQSNLWKICIPVNSIAPMNWQNLEHKYLCGWKQLYSGLFYTGMGEYICQIDFSAHLCHKCASTLLYPVSLLRWSTQRANGQYKDHLVGQLTRGKMKYLSFVSLSCPANISAFQVLVIPQRLPYYDIALLAFTSLLSFNKQATSWGFHSAQCQLHNTCLCNTNE